MEPKLNDALLAATEEDVNEVEQLPKRNTKDDLIGKIIACCADNGLKPPRGLWSMTKDQLCKVSVLSEVLLNLRAMSSKNVMKPLIFRTVFFFDLY